MPHAVDRINVFVASASDVSQERDTLKQLVGKLNHRYDRWGLALQVVNWESSIIPDFGIDPQDVINRQLRFDGIDIFLGIVWARIGTATPRAISGTVEEMNQALASRRDTGRPWRIMFFLCDRPIPPKTIDAYQIQEAIKFRQWLESFALCKHYSDINSFNDEAHNSLLMAVDEYLRYRDQQYLPPLPQPKPITWNWTDTSRTTIFIFCPWCERSGSVGTMPSKRYENYRGSIWNCPRCAMPHFFP